MSEPTVHILCSAKTASRLCDVSLPLWYRLESEQKVPAPTFISTKKLWLYSDLMLWAKLGCPGRHSKEWQKVLNEKQAKN